MRRPLRARRERPSAETTPVVTVEFETERVADRDHKLAPLEELGIAESRRWQRHRFVDAQECKISVGIVADQPGVQILPVGRRHRNTRAGTGRAGDVAVGEDKAVRRHNDTRAGAAARLLGAWTARPDHGGADAIDDVDDRTRIGVQQRLILGRNGKLGGCGGLTSAQAGVTQGHNLHGISPCLAGIADRPASRGAHMGIPAGPGKGSDCRCS